MRLAGFFRRREHQRTLERGGDALCHRKRRVGGGVGQQQRELVAAEARDDVAVAHHVGRQARGHGLEQAVAEGVAENVVDILEAVEVEDDHRHAAAGRGGQADRVRTASRKRARLGMPVRRSV